MKYKRPKNVREQLRDLALDRYGYGVQDVDDRILLTVRVGDLYYSEVLPLSRLCLEANQSDDTGRAMEYLLEGFDHKARARIARHREEAVQ